MSCVVSDSFPRISGAREAAPGFFENLGSGMIYGIPLFDFAKLSRISLARRLHCKTHGSLDTVPMEVICHSEYPTRL